MVIAGYMIVAANVFVAAAAAHNNMWPLPILNLFVAGIVLRSLWSKS